MKQSLVPVQAEESDQESIIKLQQLVWGSAEEATHEYFQWCLKNPAGQSIVYIIKDESGRVLSMHMLVLMPACLKGNRILAGISINVVTHPNYRRKGFSNQVANSIYAEARNLGIEFLFSVPNSMSHALFTQRNNFSDLGRPPLLIRWIDPGILIGQRGFPNLAKGLGFLTKLISRAFSTGKTCFTKVTHLEDLEGLNVEKLLEPTDFHFAIDAHWLKWRYGKHPFRKYEFAMVGDFEAPQALVVYEVIQLYKRALILEFLAVQEVSLKFAQALMEEVVQKCKAAGCSSVCCLGSPISRKTDLLRKSGFWGFPFDSVWRPRIVVSGLNGLPDDFSLSSMDISYGSLINVG